MLDVYGSRFLTHSVYYSDLLSVEVVYLSALQWLVVARKIAKSSRRQNETNHFRAKASPVLSFVKRVIIDDTV